jgi:hypothetical protein
MNDFDEAMLEEKAIVRRWAKRRQVQEVSSLLSPVDFAMGGGRCPPYTAEMPNVVITSNKIWKRGNPREMYSSYRKVTTVLEPMFVSSTQASFRVEEEALFQNTKVVVEGTKRSPAACYFSGWT